MTEETTFMKNKEKHISIHYVDDITDPNVKHMTMKLEDGPAPRKTIPEKEQQYIVSQLRQWLGNSGVKQFKQWREKHGTVSPVLFYGSFPHAVHFREGMQVRNFLRAYFGTRWTDHEYDDNWQWLVEEAIDSNEPIKETKQELPEKPPSDAKKVDDLLKGKAVEKQEPVQQSWWKDFLSRLTQVSQGGENDRRE